jgi:putative membrane protein
MQNGTSFLIRLLITALAIILTSYLLPGVHVENFLSAIILSLLMALLNVTLKPILVIITIPVTFLTLGLFLLVINALMVLLADAILPGFIVDGFWWAVAFSIVLWIINSLLRGIVK